MLGGGKMLKSLIQKAKHIPEVPIPTGTLSEEQLNLRLSVHHGLPRAASILAFEPVQRLLAVASLDGRIKVFGAAGVEALFQSPTRAPCNFLKFNSSGQLIHITADNDIEIWDLEKQGLACSLKWESGVTAFAVIPGTPFMYVGNDLGTVSVIQFDEQQQQLVQLPYGIPAHVTLGGIVRPGSSTAPSVVSILPHLDAVYSRLVIAYANGLLILWGLHENKVLAMRGGTSKQRELLAQHAASLQEPSFTEMLVEQAASISEQFHLSPPKGTALKEVDDEEKEICTVCWAYGNTLVAGYVDGDVWIWSFPPISKEKGETSCPVSSGAPLRKLDLAPGKSTRMPVIVLSWSASSKSSKGGGGRLYVFGGGEVGSPEVLTVVSLEGEASEKKLVRLELLLHGSFADLSLVPSPGDTPMAALLVLTSPGQLHLYDEAGIASCFGAQNGNASSSLQPVEWPTPVPDTTAAKFVLLPQNSPVTTTLLQLSGSGKDVVPPSLAAGTKWPINGGEVSTLSSSSRQTLLHQRILLTGLKSGNVQLWDTSTPSLQLVHTIENQSKTNATSVTALEFCSESEYLAVGNGQGEVSLHRLSAAARELSCHLINNVDNPKGTETSLNASPGFQCLFVSHVHQVAIQSLAIASRMQRLAAGDAAGLISVIDLATWSLLFLGDAFESKINSSISSIAFTTASISDEGIPLSPPVSPFGSKKRPSTSLSSIPVIFAANKEGSVVVVDGGTGRGILSPGPVCLKHSTTVVSMYLLDAYGAPLSTISNQETKEVAGTQPFPTSPGSEASFVLLCLEESLRLYSTTSVIQGVRKTLRKLNLQAPCLQAFPFESPSTHACGLFLLYKSGQTEVRSLPDLTVLQEKELSTLIGCQLDPSSLKSFTWTRNGQVTMVHGNSELVQLSSLAEENDLRLPGSLPRLFDKGLATASQAAMIAPTQAPKKKSMIGVMKEIRSAIIEQPPAEHSSFELPKLFSTRPFTILSANSRSKGSAESSSSALEIEDIDIDEPTASSPRTSMTRKEKLVSRLKRGFKGKEKSNEADSRAQLLDENQDEVSPRVRSADSIKAAYGHKPSGDTSSMAAMSRDKLIERREKLQAINKNSEEMQEGAQNFASLAEELAKQIENKKWYEF